jgi:hypothetical protein
LAIDDELLQKIIVEQEDGEHNIGKDNNILQSKLHTIPRGVVNIENLLDL